MDEDRGRPQMSWSSQGLNFHGPPEDELARRRRLKVEEYKRELVAQMEEQRRRRELEKVARLEEERRWARERQAQQRKYLQDVPVKRQEERPKRTDESRVSTEVSQTRRRTPVCNKTAQSLGSILALSHHEMMQRKHLQPEEYKRELVAQMEEHRKRRDRERAEQLAEDRRLAREREIKMKSQNGQPGKRQEVLQTKKEESLTSTGVMQKHRYFHNLIDPTEAEEIMKKHLKEEEYKRELDAQVEEQRLRKEQEKVARLKEEQAKELVEDRRAKREQEFKMRTFPYDAPAKRQEEPQKNEEFHANVGPLQTPKYAHNLSCLMDPAQLERNQNKRVRDKEHKRELDIQLEEQRQRKEKEKAFRQAEEHTVEQRLKLEWEINNRKQKEVFCKKQDLCGKFQKDPPLKKEESRTSIGSVQNTRHPPSVTSLQDSVQIEPLQKKNIKDEENKQEKEKVEQPLKEKRVSCGQLPNQSKSQIDVICKKEDLHTKKRQERAQSPRPATPRTPLTPRMPAVARKSHSISRHDTQHIKGLKSLDMLGYAVGCIARLEAVGPNEVALRIVNTQDAAVQTDQTDDPRPLHYPVAFQMEESQRQPSPPIPTIQKLLQQQPECPSPPPSEGGAEADQTLLPTPSGPPLEDAQSGDPLPEMPTPPALEDPLLLQYDQKAILNALYQLREGMLAKLNDLQAEV